MIDVAEAIDAEAVSVGYQPVAAAGGAYVHGKYVPNAAAPTTIMAAIQPANGRQLMDLPEGVRQEARFTGWSRSAVKNDDRITFDGLTWRVCYVWPRPMDGFTRFALGQMPA